MRFWLAALLLPAVAGAQTVLHDFKCSSPTITPGNPTTITCPDGHGFQPGTSPKVKFWNATGNWNSLNGPWKARLLKEIGTTDTELLINRADHLADLPVTVRIDNENITCSSLQGNKLYNCVRGGGAASHGRAVVNLNYGSSTYTATVVDANTLTIPVDSSTWGDPTTQIYMEWAAGTGRQIAFASDGGEGFGAEYRSENGKFRIDVPSCTNTSDRFQCQLGWLPEGTGRAKKDIGISSYTVTGGTAHITLNSYTEDSAIKLELGRIVWIQNMDDDRLNGPFVVTQLGSQTPPTEVWIDVSDTGVPDGSYAGASMRLRMTERNYAFFWVFYPGNRSGDTNNPWRNHMLKGTWDPNFTRLRFTATFGKDFVRRSDGGYTGQFGTYVPGHYYHYVNPNLYAGREMTIVVTQKPAHSVGQNSGVIYPYNPTKTGDLTRAAGPDNYWHSMTNAYIKINLNQVVNDPSGQTVWYGPLYMETVTGEPDAFIGLLTAVWDDSLQGLAQQGYELTWWGPKKQTCKYEVRYSTQQSIKTIGWSNATVGETGISYNGGVWAGRIAQIPMAEQARIWFGIRPYDIQVYGVSGDGQSPIWLTTRAVLGLGVGDTISVSSVGGNTAANQTNAAITDVRNFQVWRVVDGTLGGITAVGGTCTVDLAAGQTHNLVPGWEIVVRGSDNTNLGNPYAGTFYNVSAIVDADSFQFPCPGVADGIYVSDYSNAIRFAVMAMPGVAIAGTGNGDWTGGGAITPTGESNGFFEVMLTQVQSSSPPAAPGMLNAASVTTTSVRLEWADQAATEDNYEVERKTGAQGSYATIAVLPDNTVTYTDTGLSPDTTYFYRVRAVNVYGASSYSNEVQVTTLPAGGVVAPSGPSADVILNDQAKLSWTDNSTGETAYVVEVDSGGGFQDWASLPPDTTAYTVAGLSPATAYTFRIRVTDGISTAYSASLPVTTRETLPLRLASAPGPAAVHWIATAPAGGACDLTLRAAGQPDLTPSQDDVLRSRHLLVTGLSADTEYAYEIVCGGSATHGGFRTRAAASGTATMTFSAEIPELASTADNLVVDWGAGVGALTNTVSAPCSAGRCSLTADFTSGTVVWVRRRWCANRAADPNCQEPANELARSAPEPFIVP